jgi:hypothetical protein
MIRRLIIFTGLVSLLMLAAIMAGCSPSEYSAHQKLNDSYGHTCVKGIITDMESGDALPGATITLTNSLIDATTDAEGQFTICNIPAGKYRLNVRIIGYYPVQEYVVDVSVNQTVRIDFGLRMISSYRLE